MNIFILRKIKIRSFEIGLHFHDGEFRGLLGEGRHSVIGAAFSSGYGDLSNFYRLFRQRHGLPPREWADRAQRKAAVG